MQDHLHIIPEEISLKSLHGYLLSAVAPRPIAFASTVDSVGNVNLSPFSFFNVFSVNPPVLIFSPARRGRDNTTKHTYQNLKEIPELTINIVDYEMAYQMSLSSSEYDKGVNEFTKAGFTAIKSTLVKPPRVGESPVSFECNVDQIIALGNEGGAGNLILAHIKLIHIKNSVLMSNNEIDPTLIHHIGRMGGEYYCKAFGDALFEIPKPGLPGIGFDQLPKHILTSNVLSANDLGQLASLTQLPSEKEITDLQTYHHIKELFRNNTNDQKIALHQIAKKLIKEGDVKKALAVLFIDN